MIRRALFGLLCGVLLTQMTPAIADDQKMLAWDTAFGVAHPFLRGDNNPVRGLLGGGVQWEFKRIKGELKTNGDLEVQIRGLVVAATGTNPVAFFLAAVSCDNGDNNAPTNVFTTQADTEMIGDTTNGNAMIKASLTLPSPCVAPVVFVTSPTGAWFAVTGTAGPTP